MSRLVHGCLLMIFQNSTEINAMNNSAVTFFQVIGFQGSICVSKNSHYLDTDFVVDETLLDGDLRH
ncbi:hypothetical protein BDV06DRAFT_69171 [Aspergillus oleicola]